jgi:hypothetical protein
LTRRDFIEQQRILKMKTDHRTPNLRALALALTASVLLAQANFASSVGANGYGVTENTLETAGGYGR